MTIDTTHLQNQQPSVDIFRNDTEWVEFNLNILIFNGGLCCFCGYCFTYTHIYVYIYMKVKVAQLFLTLCDPMDCIMYRWLEWVTFPFSRGSSQPRDWTWSPALQADSLLAEPQRKSKNTEMGSLSLLQGIFPTQELNWGLLHCRLIFYQLSYQRSPINR